MATLDTKAFSHVDKAWNKLRKKLKAVATRDLKKILNATANATMMGVEKSFATESQATFKNGNFVGGLSWGSKDEDTIIAYRAYNWNTATMGIRTGRLLQKIKQRGKGNILIRTTNRMLSITIKVFEDMRTIKRKETVEYAGEFNDDRRLLPSVTALREIFKFEAAKAFKKELKGYKK